MWNRIQAGNSNCELGCADGFFCSQVLIILFNTKHEGRKSRQELVTIGLTYLAIGLTYSGIGATYSGIGVTYSGIGVTYSGIGATYSGIGVTYSGIGGHSLSIWEIYLAE